MFRSEAIRLASGPEQSHEHHDPHDLAAASTHDRGHADRKLALTTQNGYIRAVRHFAGFLRRSPDTASAEDLRRYQLHCVDRGVSPITLNATITGLKFFFEVTLGRADLMAKMRPVPVAQTLPVILSREEVGRLIESARNLKHRTALSVAYGAGLRASEVIALKVADIDSSRMVLRVEQGKGRARSARSHDDTAPEPCRARGRGGRAHR